MKSMNKTNDCKTSETKLSPSTQVTFKAGILFTMALSCIGGTWLASDYIFKIRQRQDANTLAISDLQKWSEKMTIYTEQTANSLNNIETSIAEIRKDVQKNANDVADIKRIVFNFQ